MRKIRCYQSVICKCYLINEGGRENRNRKRTSREISLLTHSGGYHLSNPSLTDSSVLGLSKTFCSVGSLDGSLQSHWTSLLKPSCPMGRMLHVSLLPPSLLQVLFPLFHLRQSLLVSCNGFFPVPSYRTGKEPQEWT